jgi:hypothetical protein
MLFLLFIFNIILMQFFLQSIYFFITLDKFFLLIMNLLEVKSPS